MLGNDSQTEVLQTNFLYVIKIMPRRQISKDCGVHLLCLRGSILTTYITFVWEIVCLYSKTPNVIQSAGVFGCL